MYSKALKFQVSLFRNLYLNRIMTKPTKCHICPAKTQINLRIRPVWSESSLCTQWVAKVPMFLQGASEDSHQTGRCPCWSEPSLEADVILSCGGSLIALKEFTVENHYMWKNRKSNISSCVVRCQATDQTIFILLLQSADTADNDR